jgi:hypothetical protein
LLLLRWRTAALLLLLLAALIVLLLLALIAIASALFLLLLLLRTPIAALLRPRAVALAALIAPRLRFAGARLPLAKLLLHVAACLRLRLRARLVEAAVGTPLPPFGVRLLAVRAGDALRQRHRKSARIVHFGAMLEEARRKTLLTLIALAEGHSPNDCWDDRRAEDLLRSQSTPEELRELGMSEKTIEHIFAETHG